MKQHLKQIILLIIKKIEVPYFKLKKRKYILFSVSDELMLNSMQFIYNNLKEYYGFKLFVCFSPPCTFTDSRLKKLYKKYLSVPYCLAKYLKWDLILFFDHDLGFRRDVKKIYYGHGTPLTKVVMGKDNRVLPYAFYSDGEYKYDKLVVFSDYQKKVFNDICPQISDKIVTIGCLKIHEIMNKTYNKEILFKQWGLDFSKKTIMFISTWEDSLIAAFGKDLCMHIPALLEDYNILVVFDQVKL